MLLLALLSPAWALEIPAPTSEQRVYKIPSTWAMPVHAVTAAAERTERKVWVVAYETVIDGVIAPGRSSETEDAIEQVWAAWESGGGVFSPQNDALVLLGMDDREVRVRMGSEWDSRLGLHNERLLPLIDQNFLPRAQANDYDGGLAALVTAVDKAVADGLAELERRRAAEAKAAVDRAKAEAEQAAEAERVRIEEEARTARIRAVAPWGAGGVVLAGAGLALGLRRRRARAAQVLFEAAVAERRARLDRADTSFASFRVDTELRDRIVELRLKGPVTTAAFREVSTTLDRIQVGLAALRDRLDFIESSATPGPLEATPWEAARRELDAPFSIETGRIEHRLFESPSETLEIAPLAFMAALEADYAAARAGWERLLDAVKATLRRATDDLKRAPLDAHLERLEAAGLPRAWADAHPLANDPETTWSTLEEARTSDPVAYLGALHAALEDAAEAADTVDEVIEDKGAAEAARARALAVADTPDTVFAAGDSSEEERDPERVRVEAERCHTELDAAFGAAGDLAVAEGAADRAIAAWDRLAATREALARTVTTVGAALTTADDRLEDLQERFHAARTQAQALAGEHAGGSMGVVWREIQEAATDLAEAEAEVARARELLVARRHVAAEGAVASAVREHGKALVNLEELNAAMAKLVAAKADVVRQLTTLDDLRARHLGKLAGFGVFGDVGVLVPGDRLWAALRDEPTTGTIDWTARQDRLYAVLSAWQDAVSHAAYAWLQEQENLRRIREEEERERRHAREAEERRRRARQARDPLGVARRDTSVYRAPSTFGSSPLGGSPFGGGGRSGGSSFGGGGGRSGGRKF